MAVSVHLLASICTLHSHSLGNPCLSKSEKLCFSNCARSQATFLADTVVPWTSDRDFVKVVNITANNGKDFLRKAQTSVLPPSLQTSTSLRPWVRDPTFAMSLRSLKCKPLYERGLVRFPFIAVQYTSFTPTHLEPSARCKTQGSAPRVVQGRSPTWKTI